jgi:hypothetical protein
MISADPISTRVKRKDNNNKMTKVLSTKISNEDYDQFGTYTNLACKAARTEAQDRDVKTLTTLLLLTIE